MSRFLLAPVVAVLALAGVPAHATEGIPGLAQCLTVKETASQLGFQVCVPPIGG